MRSLLSLFHSISRRYLAKRWDRAVLVVASIALGVAMLVSTRVLNRCVDAAGSRLNIGADLLVTGSHGVRLDLAAPLREVPGVRAVMPILIERVQLPDDDNRATLLMGIDLNAARQADLTADDRSRVKWSLTNPLALLSGRGVLVGRSLADKTSKSSLAVRAGGRVHQLQPAGILDFDGLAAKLGGNLLVMEISQAARLVGNEGRIGRIDVYLAPGADAVAVAAELQRRAGDAALVRSPEAHGQSTEEVVGGVRIGFTLCGLGAIIVGLFLVYNALAVSVAERRHDIGVLRSLGATRIQIATLFSGEAALLGAFGSLLGLPLGMGLARLTLEQVRGELAELYESPNQPLYLSAGLVLLAVGSGVATAVLASLVPALQAAADEPADAVRRGPSGGRRLFQFFQAGASLTLVGCGLVLVFTRDYLPTRVGGYGGMFAMFIGLLLAVPVLVGWIARILLPIARRVFGVEARLAADNLLRAPGRTGVVVGALAAGVALMTLTAGVCTSSERPIVDWLRRSLTADIFVLAGGKENLTSLVLPMAPTTADEIRAMPGVEHVVGMRFTQPEYNGRIAYLIACDAEVYLKSHRARDAAPHIGKFQYLSRPGMALISENFAALNRLKVNDTLSLRGPKGPVQLQVAGIIPEYSWSRGSILVDRAWYAREYDDPLLDLCHVFAAPGREDEVRRQVEEFCGRRALFPFSRSELDSYLNDVIRRVYQLAYLQQVVVAIVAALGVVMALLISVLQRRRELGLLRAVGATSGQVLYSVLAEAALMGIFGTILGIAAGIPLEWYVLRVLILEESGFLFPLLVPWREVLVIGVVAVVAATLAGLMPAVRASRLEIAAAVAYE